MSKDNEGIFGPNHGTLFNDIKHLLLLEGLALTDNRIKSIESDLRKHHRRGDSTFKFLYSIIDTLKPRRLQNRAYIKKEVIVPTIEQNDPKKVYKRDYLKEKITKLMRELKLTESEVINYLQKKDEKRLEKKINIQSKKEAKKIYFQSKEQIKEFRNLKSAAEWVQNQSLNNLTSFSGAKAHIIKHINLNKQPDRFGFIWYRKEN